VEVARFNARLQPKQGRIRLAEAPTPRAAYDYAGSALDWDACGLTCVPPAGTAALWTEQSKVTYVAFDGSCYANGGPAACPTTSPCNQPGVFCAPLQAVSNVTLGGARGLLPDVIVQLSQDSNLENTVEGCLSDAGRTYGLCTGNGKVDSASSGLTSPIPGDPAAPLPSEGCSYCYGNQTVAAAQGRPGLQHGLLSGNDAALRAVNTSMIALQLENDNDYDVIITVRQARPTFDAPATQLELKDGATTVSCGKTSETRVVVRGGGFGPPAACLSETLGACPLSGPPANGYRMEFASGSGFVAATGVVWSDGEVSGVLPPGAHAGTVRLVTPQAPGGVATTQVFQHCIRMDGAFVAGATPNASGGGVNAKVEMGRGLAPTTATGVDGNGQTVTMKVGRAVEP
jgi:hypothetical protein